MNRRILALTTMSVGLLCVWLAHVATGVLTYNDMLAPMEANTIKGRIGSTGSPQNLAAAAQVAPLLPLDQLKEPNDTTRLDVQWNRHGLVPRPTPGRAFVADPNGVPVWGTPAAGGGSGTIDGTVAAGQVVFGNDPNTIASSADFRFDPNTSRVAIKAAGSTNRLDVQGGVSIGYNGNTAAPSNGLLVGGVLAVGGGEADSPIGGHIRGTQAGGSDMGGADLTIDASNGTGSGGSGNIIIRTAASGVGSGTMPSALDARVIITPSGHVEIYGPIQIQDGTEGSSGWLHDTGSGLGAWEPLPTYPPTPTPVTFPPTPTPGAGAAANAVDTAGMTAGRFVFSTDPNSVETHADAIHDPNTHLSEFTANQTSALGTMTMHSASSGVGASLCLDANDPNGVDVRWSLVASQTWPFVVRTGCGSGPGDGSTDVLRATSQGALQLRQIGTPDAPDPNWTAFYAKAGGIYYRPGGGSETQLSGNGALTVTTPSGSEETQIKTRLLLHFDGTNGSTTFTDESGATVTASGNAQLSTTSPQYGTAAGLFDGTGDYLTVPLSTSYELGGSDFTIEMWVKGTGTNSYACLINRPSSTGFSAGAWSLFYNPGSANGRLQFWAADYSTGAALVAASSGDVHNGSWHHVAVTRSGSTFTIWLDGSSVGTATSSAVIANGTRNLYIGTDANYGSRDHNGRIDDLRIVIGKALYTATFTPPAAAFDAPISVKLMYWDAAHTAIYAY